MAQILVCHADPSFGHLLSEVLRGEGYEVALVHDYDDALKRLLSKRFKVLILGVKQESLEAMHVLPLIKQIDRDLALITIVDDDSIEIQRAIRKQKVFYHLVQPLDYTEIKAAVDNAVARA